MSPNYYTEDHLIEQPAILLMQHELGWEVVIYYGKSLRFIMASKIKGVVEIELRISS